MKQVKSRNSNKTVHNINHVTVSRWIITLENITISPQDILDAIDTLKIDKAPGIDGNHYRLLN